MELATFRVSPIRVPCRVVRTAGRIGDRLRSEDPWQEAFLRLVERLHSTPPRAQAGAIGSTGRTGPKEVIGRSAGRIPAEAGAGPVPYSGSVSGRFQRALQPDQRLGRLGRD